MMPLLSDAEQQRVADAIAVVERGTDAELVTVLARRADDYRYIPLLWAACFALITPGALLFAPLWLELRELFLIQWLVFFVLAALFRIPALMMRLVPSSVRRWRAANLARRQFLEQNLHHTRGATGMLIFVAEAERYVEIIADHGISAHVDDQQWQGVIDTFTGRVRCGETLQGFLHCVESCGELLQRHVPATTEKNELPNRLIVLD